MYITPGTLASLQRYSQSHRPHGSRPFLDLTGTILSLHHSIPEAINGGMDPGGGSCWQLFWEPPVTKEPAALWIALLLTRWPFPNYSSLSGGSIFKVSKFGKKYMNLRMEIPADNMLPNFHSDVICTLLLATSNSAIHKAASQMFFPVGTTPRGCSSHQLHSQLMGVSGIVPGKIMEWPGTVRPTALWIAL